MKPDDIAAIRPLIEWASANGYEHATYQINFNSPREHNWRTLNGADEIRVWDGVLIYDRHGVRRLTVNLDNPRQAAQLLAVYGIGVAS